MDKTELTKRIQEIDNTLKVKLHTRVGTMRKISIQCEGKEIFYANPLRKIMELATKHEYCAYIDFDKRALVVY